MLLPLIQIIPLFMPVIRTARGDFPSGASKWVCNKKIWCLFESQETSSFPSDTWDVKFKDWSLGQMISQHYLVPCNRRSCLLDFCPCYLPPTFLCEQFSRLSWQANLQVGIMQSTLALICYRCDVILWWTWLSIPYLYKAHPYLMSPAIGCQIKRSSVQT
jgi:hypothetical protein